MDMDQERLIAVFQDAYERAKVECPDALQRAEERWTASMREWLGVMLPFVPEQDRQPLIKGMLTIPISARRPAS